MDITINDVNVSVISDSVLVNRMTDRAVSERGLSRIELITMTAASSLTTDIDIGDGSILAWTFFIPDPSDEIVSSTIAPAHAALVRHSESYGLEVFLADSYQEHLTYLPNFRHQFSVPVGPNIGCDAITSLGLALVGEPIYARGNLRVLSIVSGSEFADNLAFQSIEGDPDRHVLKLVEQISKNRGRLMARSKCDDWDACRGQRGSYCMHYFAKCWGRD